MPLSAGEQLFSLRYDAPFLYTFPRLPYTRLDRLLFPLFQNHKHTRSILLIFIIILFMITTLIADVSFRLMPMYRTLIRSIH